MSKGELRAARKLHFIRFQPIAGRAARLSSSISMKHIKLSGREQAVLRAIDYTSGSTGDEIREITHIDADELADILNGLCDAGYVEVFPYAEKVTFLSYATSRFEQNPSYALELKEALRRH